MVLVSKPLLISIKSALYESAMLFRLMEISRTIQMLISCAVKTCIQEFPSKLKAIVRVQELIVVLLTRQQLRNCILTPAGANANAVKGPGFHSPICIVTISCANRLGNVTF